MKIFSINCQSWKTAKQGFNEIVDNYGIDVLCLTETFETNKEPVTFRQWSKISKPRSDGYGGVAILYKDSEDGLVFERKENLEEDGIECICAKVTVTKDNSFLLVVAYVPPEKKEQLEGLLRVLDKCKEYKHIVLTGDLNAKSQSWNNKKANPCGTLLDEYLLRNGLLCINDGQPTRRASDSVIDLFVVSPRVIPEVVMCETMTCENIRSDHIGVLLQVYKEKDTSKVTVEKYVTSKTDWELWKTCSEQRFKLWNEADTEFETVDDMAESFTDIYTQCMTEAVPKKELKLQSRRKKPPWWTDVVGEAKNELNKAKKGFRCRRTPSNLEKLKTCENAFEKAKEEAKVEWTQVLCDKITYASSSKEMWESFNALTTYEDNDRGGVLPLMDENDNPTFGREEKCEILEKVFFGGKHLERCKFDDNFRDEVEKELKENIEENKNSQEFLNYDITLGEVEAVVQQLKKNKSPGPDNVYTEMLQNAGEEFLKAVLRLFQMSWETAKVPVKWKEAEVKFLRKNGKKSYHDPGSYRPISLTSYLCKCLERIVTSRLYGFAEHFKLLDKEQEGFRKFRGTQDALLRLTQDIFNGFNSNEHTAALFIDIEKAYDSVWRDGLMVKLKEKGITGRIWYWIRDFLTDRSAAITMSGVKGQSFDTAIGLPQGSVISPLLFSLFIADWYENVKSEKVKFADDGTIWISGKNWKELIKSLREDFIEVMKWARKWRLKLSITKTEFCIFSLDNQVLEEARKIVLDFDGQSVKYNPNPKILGVTLDEKLKFEVHVESVERKALRSLNSLRKVKETEIISTSCMLQLYRALVLPQLEYAAPVWQIGNCSCLEKVQRKGLAMCLGVPGTAGVEALEVEAGVKPLELRREELAVRQAAKIMTKADETCIKSSWDRFMETDQVERKISPFGKMNVQVADMVSNTGIPLHCLEKECTYAESLRPSKSKPEYWQNLGSSKSRTKMQEALSRELIGNMLENCNETTAIAFTDGSCLGNPGPCGAGACIFPPGHTEPILLKHPVSSCGSILLGELVAIKLAVKHIQTKTTGRDKQIIEKLHVFSDSQCAIGHLTLGWEAKSHKATIQEVKSDIQKLEESGVNVEISWTPGHSDIKGNEYADKLAKEAAEEAKEKTDIPPVLTMGDIKTAVRDSGRKKWQDMWDKSEKGRNLFNYRPKVDYKVKHKFESRKGESIVSQLRTGYVKLNEYLQKSNITENDKCQCGEIESVKHFLLECEIYENEREKLRSNLFRSCGITHFDMNVLLDLRPDDEFKEWRSSILEELETFVVESKRFATRSSN